MISRILKILVALIIIIVLVIVGLFTYSLIRAGSPEDLVRVNELNTKVYIALNSGGIPDAVVDITSERAFVRFNLPDGMDEEVSWTYTLTMLSIITPEVEQAVVEVYKDFVPQTRVTSKMADLLALADGLIDSEEFGDRTKIEVIS